jgi:hypothetical protein
VEQSKLSGERGTAAFVRPSSLLQAFVPAETRLYACGTDVVLLLHFRVIGLESLTRPLTTAASRPCEIVEVDPGQRSARISASAGNARKIRRLRPMQLKARRLGLRCVSM